MFILNLRFDHIKKKLEHSYEYIKVNMPPTFETTLVWSRKNNKIPNSTVNKKQQREYMVVGEIGGRWTNIQILGVS